MTRTGSGQTETNDSVSDTSALHPTPEQSAQSRQRSHAPEAVIELPRKSGPLGSVCLRAVSSYRSANYPSPKARLALYDVAKATPSYRAQAICFLMNPPQDKGHV